MTRQELFDEDDLIHLISQGNQLAFQKLFELYRNKVYGIAFKLTHSSVIAEEILEDVFMKIWTKRSGLTEINNIGAYLLIITRNDAYRALKKIARDCRLSHKSVDAVGDVGNESINHPLEEKDYKEKLHSVIDRLPKQQRLVFRLIKEEGMKREEVANALHLSPETVKFHLSQAVKTLRTYWIQHLEFQIGLLCSSSALAIF
jgi:RNA polymerase sigma-70 factor (family 1)